MKYLVILAFVAIIASLAAALLAMLRGDSGQAQDAHRSRRMARALALRVGLSVLLFAALLLAHQLGWIRPGSMPLH
ncbi:MAG: hypothetical protein RJA36_3052 [Pseudomonadota bacterium]|jgi:hypothetical protein